MPIDIEDFAEEVQDWEPSEELKAMATVCWFYHYTPTEYWALTVLEHQALVWAMNEANKSSK